MAILIKNRNVCPACATRNSIRWDQHRCAQCNVPVFHPTDDFRAMKDNWVLAFWVFFPLDSSGLYKGWVHSSHLQDGIPNDADYAVADPGPNYNKTSIVEPIPLKLNS